jgi:predicted ester cyclase
MSPLMNTDQNIATYRRFIQEVFNDGRLDAIKEFLSPAYVFHDAPPDTPPGRDGTRQIVSSFRAAFPDLEISIEDQVAEEDKVCSRTTMRGTHKGLIFGIAGTGGTLMMTGFTMVRIVGGRLVESWVKNDVIGLMNQLGGNPVPR